MPAAAVRLVIDELGDGLPAVNQLVRADVQLCDIIRRLRRKFEVLRGLCALCHTTETGARHRITTGTSTLRELMARGVVRPEDHADGSSCFVSQGNLCWRARCQPLLRLGVSFVSDEVSVRFEQLAEPSNDGAALQALARQNSNDERRWLRKQGKEATLRGFHLSPETLLRAAERRVARAERQLAQAEIQRTQVGLGYSHHLPSLPGISWDNFCKALSHGMCQTAMAYAHRPSVLSTMWCPPPRG